MLLEGSSTHVVDNLSENSVHSSTCLAAIKKLETINDREKMSSASAESAWL